MRRIVAPASRRRRLRSSGWGSGFFEVGGLCAGGTPALQGPNRVGAFLVSCELLPHEIRMFARVEELFSILGHVPRVSGDFAVPQQAVVV